MWWRAQWRPARATDLSERGAGMTWRMRNAAGFTLVELLIVVFVLGIAAMIALPNFQDERRLRLDAVANEVADALRFARNESMRTGTSHGVRVTDTSGPVRVFELDAAGERRVAIPSELDRLRRHARELPRAQNLRRLGEALRRERPALGPLRIEVHRTVFAREDLAPRSVPIARLEMP